MIDKKTKAFAKWFEKLPFNAQTVVNDFINRVLDGNTSNCKSVGKGVSELSINYQRGYRIYYTVLKNNEILLLLAGGTKGGNQKQQQADIALAQKIRENLKTGGVI
ncbi:MAG: type II toxin-antitoxin system RelE/ParE family toxin [Endomicrobia bacterium]|nr:type II toxin-antitoxin system RelE/ParE family toxin [Endomicrobiia bacterium]